MQLLKKHGAFICGALATLLLVAYSCRFPFFWDTIQLGSKQANWFYSQNFNQFYLPNQIDSGHFPLFGLLLAGVWSFLGKSLVVSHFFMLPFLLMIVYYTIQIGKSLTDSNFSYAFLFLIFCNPYFLGQTMLVSPDMVLLAFFSMCLYGYLDNKRYLILAGAVGLSLISIRGLILVFILLSWILYQRYFLKQANRNFKWFIPGVLLGLSYQLLHYLHKGWAVYHSDSPWIDSFESAYQLDVLMRNAGIFIWRLVDFGNVFLWLALLILITIGKGRKSVPFPLLIISVVAYFFVTVPKVGLLNHRYYLPIIFLLMYTVLELLHKSSFQYKKVIVIALCCCALFGNLWTYPEGTAQGWDSTLAHVPYHQLMDEAIQYFSENEINIEEVGAAFPANNKMSDIYLNKDQRSFKKFDLDNDKYILYSNVMNDFDSEHIFELDNLWKVVLYKKKGHVVVTIFERQ